MLFYSRLCCDIIEVPLMMASSVIDTREGEMVEVCVLAGELDRPITVLFKTIDITGKINALIEIIPFFMYSLFL